MTTKFIERSDELEKLKEILKTELRKHDPEAVKNVLASFGFVYENGNLTKKSGEDE